MCICKHHLQQSMHRCMQQPAPLPYIKTLGALSALEGLDVHMQASSPTINASVYATTHPLPLHQDTGCTFSTRGPRCAYASIISNNHCIGVCNNPPPLPYIKTLGALSALEGLDVHMQASSPTIIASVYATTRPLPLHQDTGCTFSTRGPRCAYASIISNNHCIGVCNNPPPSLTSRHWVHFQH